MLIFFFEYIKNKRNKIGFIANDNVADNEKAFS